MLDYRWWCGPADICQETLYGCFDDRDCPEYEYPEGYVFASFDVTFVDSGGGEEPTEPEEGGQCKDGEDNDGDGFIDCDDPDCDKWCP